LVPAVKTAQPLGQKISPKGACIIRRMKVLCHQTRLAV